MNVKLKNVFPGKVVNKRLTFNTGMDEFPRYVLEYLIDNYCSEETFDQDRKWLYGGWKRSPCGQERADQTRPDVFEAAQVGP